MELTKAKIDLSKTLEVEGSLPVAAVCPFNAEGQFVDETKSLPSKIDWQPAVTWRWVKAANK